VSNGILTLNERKAQGRRSEKHVKAIIDIKIRLGELVGGQPFVGDLLGSCGNRRCAFILLRVHVDERKGRRFGAVRCPNCRRALSFSRIRTRDMMRDDFIGDLVSTMKYRNMIP
jgi:hypothetical protein